MHLNFGLKAAKLVKYAHMSNISVQMIFKGASYGGILLLAGFLAACASLPQNGESSKVTAASAEESADQPKPTASFSEPLLYELLLGEIAGQRSQLDIAIVNYLDAANEAQDPRVAERALRIAAFAEQLDKALLAARRWVALDGSNLNAIQTLAVLEMRVGDRDQGVIQLERIIEIEPEPARAYERIVAALARIPNKQLALDVIAQVVGRHSGESEAHLSQSRLAADAGQLDLALGSIERALKLRGYWTRAEIIRAEILRSLDQAPLAKERLQRSVKRSPDDVPLRLAYARLLAGTRDLEEADREYKKVARLQPDNIDVQFSLALLALEGDRIDDAREYLLRVAKSGKRSSEASYFLGRIAEQQDRHKDALGWYSKVTQGQHWLDARVYSVSIQARSGDIEGARSVLQALRNDHPQFTVQLILTEGTILSNALRYEQAFDLYSEYLDREPDNTELLYVRALIAEKLDRLELAESDLLRVINKDPNNGAALNALGYTLADRTDRLAEAETYIVKALDLLPNDPSVIDSMGWLQYRLGNFKAAVTHLERAFEISADSEIGAHLGEVLWNMGNEAQARKVWEGARAEDPDNPVLKKVLQRYLP